MIDWGFITELEGRSLTGYWPKGFQASGVTVAGGVDLAYLSPAELAALPPDLQAKLKPYLGVRGDRAQHLLSGQPLVLTAAEADALEGPKRKSIITSLILHYFQATGTPFNNLPDAAQTVLASVAWQYGRPEVRCPAFWKAACAQDWHAVILQLCDFGDAFHTRRCREADYLETNIVTQEVTK
jgi:hypothetical protein